MVRISKQYIATIMKQIIIFWLLQKKYASEYQQKNGAEENEIVTTIEKIYQSSEKSVLISMDFMIILKN